MIDEKLLTVAEVADRLNVRTETVLRWIHSGRVKAITLQGGHYRITEAELDKIISGGGNNEA